MVSGHEFDSGSSACQWTHNGQNSGNSDVVDHSGNNGGHHGGGGNNGGNNACSNGYYTGCGGDSGSDNEQLPNGNPETCSIISIYCGNGIPKAGNAYTDVGHPMFIPPPGSSGHNAELTGWFWGDLLLLGSDAFWDFSYKVGRGDVSGVVYYEQGTNSSLVNYTRITGIRLENDTDDLYLKRVTVGSLQSSPLNIRVGSSGFTEIPISPPLYASGKVEIVLENYNKDGTVLSNVSIFAIVP